MEDTRFVERIVFFNESVIYTNDNIRITDSDDVETARLENMTHVKNMHVTSCKMSCPAWPFSV